MTVEIVNREPASLERILELVIELARQTDELRDIVREYVDRQGEQE